MFTGTSDADGTYWLRTIPVGFYEVTVEAGGFQKFEAQDIRLQVNEISRIDVRLTVGATTETVTVEANAVTVGTTTSTLKAVVDQKRIEELPLNGRNATQLMRPIVGVTNDPNANVTSGATVERELIGGFVMRTSYAGSKGTRLGSGRELNPATYVVGATTATTNQRRPLGPALGSTPIIESVSNSHIAEQGERCHQGELIESGF